MRMRQRGSLKKSVEIKLYILLVINVINEK